MSIFVQYDSEIGKKILYQPTKKVDSITAAKIQDIIFEMKHHMQGKGIGLAANQIGYPLQIFMMEYTIDPDDKTHCDRYDIDMPEVPFQVFINPKITHASLQNVSFWHGCLSALQHKRGLVSTYQWIKYSAYNEKGELIVGQLDELGAVIFQHELRHLLGQLYIDKAQDFKDETELQDLFNKKLLTPYQLADDKIPHLLSDYMVGESIEEYYHRT